MLIFHIAKNENWKQSLRDGFYGDFSIKKAGFIHCAEFSQLLYVANNNLKDLTDDLVVLCIDISRLNSEVRWETNKNNGIAFPYIYGLINTDSVIDVINIRKNKYGDFFISDELLNFSHYEKSCGAIIFHKFDDEYKVLLINFIHDNESRWGFPKGHVENNESEVQTALREIKEEVGLDVKILPNFRTSTHFSFKKGTINEAVYYCAETTFTETIALEEEVEKTGWFSFEETYKYLTYECDKKILMKFIQFFKEFFESH